MLKIVSEYGMDFMTKQKLFNDNIECQGRTIYSRNSHLRGNNVKTIIYFFAKVLMILVHF